MGLAEKRILAAYQADKFPGWQAKLKGIVGKDISFEVAWEEIVKEGNAGDYPNVLDYNFFMPLEKSLTSICRDNIGKDALSAKINKIKITSQRNFSSLEAKVESDTLLLDADPAYQRDDSAIDDYAGRITTALEAAL